jgi:hypothetical protein
MFKVLSLLSAFLLLLLTHSLFAYGPIGHQIVGEIADQKLAHTPAGDQVSALLDGMTLEKASVIPDEIKGWDKKGADDPNIFHYSSRPKLDAQLRDFWRANKPTYDEKSEIPSHHWFHYTDVPLDHPQKYADGEAGRSKWDIVHMMAYCVDVLQGRIPEENDRKITKPIAIILLAHYVGDIHQPLHVGAEYFDANGHEVDPGKDKSALGDQGGNTLEVHFPGYPPNDAGSHPKKLHPFWDEEAVDAMFPETPATMKKAERVATLEPARQKLVHELATEEPKNWRLPPNVSVRSYSEAWADEILPLAREVHERLVFKNMHAAKPHEQVIAEGEVEEKPGSEHYRLWASGIVREELHKAGWRLADLLTQALETKPDSSPTPSPTPAEKK